ncbi:MAG: tetratricopeptide repeat protein [Candidatus Omnitrophica bacterium]|nr:tetratricopeptide repeat protein [Candidatus Omnitrophota bacterium]
MQIILLAFFVFAAIYPETASAGSSKKENLDYRRMMLKNDHLEAGNIYYKIEMYEKAVDQFERALEIDPQDKKAAALLDAAKNKMGIALKPVMPREEEKRLKKLEAERERGVRLEAKKREAEEAAIKKAKAREAISEAKRERQAEEKTRREASNASKAVSKTTSPAKEEKALAPVEPLPEEPVQIKPVDESEKAVSEAPAVEQTQPVQAPPAKEEKEILPVTPAEKPVQTPPVKEEKEILPKTSAEEPVQTAAPDKSEKAPSLIPGKTGSAEPVVVNGDKVEYFHEQKRVIGVGNVSIEYKDVLLTCEKITVYLDTREAIAEGNVRVAQKGAFFTGDKVSYNFDTRQASVIDGYLNANPFYGRAKEVSKVANKDQFNLDYGYMTTCDLDKPHYRIQSKQVKIYLGDKVVAHHIFFFVGKVPIFYFPYYVQPLNEKKMHITVIPGNRKEWGYYALTSFRYYLDDKNKGDFLLDYRSKKGLAAGINHYYTVPNMGNGAFKVYYADDNGKAAFDHMGPEQTRYRYQARHDWDMAEDTGTKVTFEFNKLSDPNVIKDYFYNEYEELGTIPDNYLSIVTQKSEYSSEFMVRKSFNNFYNVVERMPEYKFDIPNLKLLKDQPLYYKLNSSAVYLNYAPATTTYQNNVFTNITPQPKDVNTARVDVYNQISYAARVFKALNLTPYAGVEETYYSKNIWDDKNLIRGIFKAGLDASIKFYKTYNVTSDFMGLNINNLRHVITPTANYYYSHQPTISKNNLNQFDAIDTLTSQNGVVLGLENRLQTKRLEGGQMKSVDLATLYITSDWAFTQDNGNTTIKYGKFKTLDFELDLIPYSWAYLVAKASINTKTNALQTSSVDLVSTGGDKWNLSAGYRYAKISTGLTSLFTNGWDTQDWNQGVSTGLTNLFTMDGMYKISEKWRIRAYERFNIKNVSFQEQEYTISRDLHCWIGEFTYNYRSNGDQSLWFVLKLKAFPDYPVGLKRTYSRPRFGSTSTGNIQ